MKKLALALAVAATALTSSAAFAKDPSANDYFQRRAYSYTYQAAADGRTYRQYEYGDYDGEYVPLLACLFFCHRSNPVKDNTWVINGVRYKACPSDPVVRYDLPCSSAQASTYGQSAEQYHGSTASTYRDGDYVYTVTDDGAGHTSTSRLYSPQQ